MRTLQTSIDNHILTIEMSRVAQKNALNRELQSEIIDCWEKFQNDDDLWIAILHGQGGIFSIGHDVTELLQEDEENMPHGMVNKLFPLHIDKPIIAAIEGLCYGLGFELALSCDLRIASQNARFGFPDRNLYVSHRVASVLLPRMTSTGVALELLLSGKTFDPIQMESLKVINGVVSEGQSLVQATTEATSMIRRFGSVKAFQKRSILQFSGIPIPTSMRIERGSDL